MNNGFSGDRADPGNFQKFAFWDFKNFFSGATIADQLFNQMITYTRNKMEGKKRKAILVHLEMEKIKIGSFLVNLFS
jgi:hypothetical protein